MSVYGELVPRESEAAGEAELARLVAQAMSRLLEPRGPRRSVLEVQLEYALELGAAREERELELFVTEHRRRFEAAGSKEPRQAWSEPMPFDQRELESRLVRVFLDGLDEKIAAVLPGGKRAALYRAGAGVREGRYTLDRAQQEILLPLLARSGRCRLTGAAPEPMLAWEEHDEPWLPGVRLVRDEAAGESRLEAFLGRGSERLATEEPARILASGFVLRGSVLAPLDPRGAARWLVERWREGPRRVPREREAELVDELTGLRAFPWIELAEADERPPLPLLARMVRVPARGGARRLPRGRDGPGQDRAGPRAARRAQARTAAHAAHVADRRAPLAGHELDPRGGVLHAGARRARVRRPRARGRARQPGRDGPPGDELRSPAARHGRARGHVLRLRRAGRGPGHQERHDGHGPRRALALGAAPPGAQRDADREPPGRAGVLARVPVSRAARPRARLRAPAPGSRSAAGGGPRGAVAALRPLILRRTKEQVLPELPEKSEQVLWCEPGERECEAYVALRDGLRAALLAKVDAEGVARSKWNALEVLLRLRQVACHPALIDLLAYRLITRGTVEEKVLELQESKRELVRAVLGEEGSLLRQLSREDIEALLS